MLTPVLALALALAGRPWDVPFSQDTAALAAAAAALPAPEGAAEVDLLLEEVFVDFDESSRVTFDSRLVAVTRTAAAVRGWGTASAGFGPWYQDRPDLKVRVVSPGGEARWLDPSTLVEATPGDQAKDELFSDRRELRGPIPGLEPGALVEERVVVRDHAPRFQAGAFLTLYWMRRMPVRRTALRVSAPAGLPLRWQADGLPMPVETLEGGRRVLRWDVSPLPAATEPEPLLPSDGPAGRRIALSTGRSWRDVAASYRALVERQLAGADLKATARAIVSPGDGPVQAAQKILDFIAAKVRYTGLALGERAIVPARPSETLARGFGDCKDMSTLAVGLLRAAGHDASVALAALERHDPFPDLPGLAFDHAVVRVGGKVPFWFDPTDPSTPAGSLPPWLQGRLALPTHPDSSALQRTPESRAADNGSSKVRRIELAEAGWAKASEDGVFRGASAADVRRYMVPGGAADLEKAARERMNAVEGEPATLKIEDGPSRTGPIRVRYAASASRWGTTGNDSAEAVVSVHPVFRNLPDVFRTEPLEPGAREEPPPARKEPLRLLAPFTADLRYEVVPPAGFRAAALPAGEKAKVGPAALESTFTTAPDGTVVVTWRLTIERRTLAPAEVDALWRDVAERTRRDGPRVRFQRTAAALLDEGKGREAVAELHRLVALQPAKARHHCHLALACLALGLGAEARAEARRAVALEPAGEWPQRVLAHALHHDLLGQPYGQGADLAGAIAAQRRAAELEPTAPLTLSQLARLLEQGALERYGPGARLEEALAVRRRVRGELKSDEGLADLATLLLTMGQPAEALEAARAAPAGPERNAVLLAAAAASRGADAMQQEAGELPAADRTAAAGSAALMLMAIGRYDLVQLLTERGQQSGRVSKGSEGFLGLAQRLKVVDPKALERRDPAALPLRLLLAAFGPEPAEAVGAMTSRPLGDPRTLVRHMLAGAAAANPAGISRRTLVDTIGAAMEVKVEGEGPPWRVRATLPALGDAKTAIVLLGVREDGEARVVYLDPTPRGYGLLAQRFARQGDLGGARRLLTWGLERATSPARPIWRNGQSAKQEELELAAYALAGPGTPEEARTMLPRLEAERSGAAGALRTALTAVAVEASMHAGEHARAQSLADELQPEGAKDRTYATNLRTRILIVQGRLAEARDELEARLAGRSDDAFGLQLLVQVTERQRDFEAAATAYRRLLAGKAPDPADFNNAAWLELFRERPADEALAWARKAVGPRNGHEALHTLATVQAWMGKPAEAMTTLRQAVDARAGAMDQYDWLVVGRIAEAYGAIGAATEAYRQVVEPERAWPPPAHELARRRLAGLEAGMARE